MSLRSATKACQGSKISSLPTSSPIPRRLRCSYARRRTAGWPCSPTPHSTGWCAAAAPTRRGCWSPPPRRTRRLSLDELVAGALILYPRYIDPVTGQRCPPEVLVDRLAAARDAAQGTPASRAAARAAYVRARHALLTPIGTMLRRMKGAVRSPARPE